MSYLLHQTKSFRKDLRRVERRAKDIAKLDRVLKNIQRGIPLLPQNHNHVLPGYQRMFELHIEADWLLVYQIANNCVRLIRTGTHADIF